MNSPKTAGDGGVGCVGFSGNPPGGGCTGGVAQLKRSHPGLVDIIRAARNFSRFAPPPGAAHFSRFARATDS